MAFFFYFYFFGDEKIQINLKHCVRLFDTVDRHSLYSDTHTNQRQNWHYFFSFERMSLFVSMLNSQACWEGHIYYIEKSHLVIEYILKTHQLLIPNNNWNIFQISSSVASRKQLPNVTTACQKILNKYVHSSA